MTSSSEPTGGIPASPGEPVPASNEQQIAEPSSLAEQSLSQPESVMNEEEGVSPPADEGLPEWEPLTPELVEDEAIRGDFVIRWAVVGLALLFGFSQIAESRTLVHVKTGEYLATHGGLPPANDVFSYTAADRRWVNLSWLFDLFSAGVHSLAGGIGLSIAQGVLAGLAFGLLAHAQRSAIRTWWGSVCAVLALLACYPQITMQAELVTLVGLAAVLFLVMRAEETSSTQSLWLLVPLIWLWSQLDNRAFLGWGLLLCLAVGESLRRGAMGDEAAATRRRQWWRVTGGAIAVSFLHPFLWETWLSPIRLYFIDYPALRQLFPRPSVQELSYFSIGMPQFWMTINHSTVAALVLFAAALMTLFLNRERLHPGHLLAVLLFSGLGALTTHELAVASLVNCAVCAVNAQVWYRQRFGQVYSVDWRELLFSRGGRAVTVLSFFALAWLVISGRIDGPGGKRTGVGFDTKLTVQMQSYRKLAAVGETGQPLQFDDRPFHFAVRQGDLLIWSGQKSFVDSRAGLFAGQGERDLISLFNKTRFALQRKREAVAGSGDPDVWKQTFNAYQITHALPRLTGPFPPPDYTTFSDLLSTPDFALTDLLAATAVFYRTDSSDNDYLKYVAGHRLEFVAKAFRQPNESAETIRDWSKPATTYDNLFALRRPLVTEGGLAAAHHVQLAASGGNLSLPVRAACALQAIRLATAGLREDPHSPEGHRVLGLAYMILDRVESSEMAPSGGTWLNMMRYYQAVAALRQAAALRPDDVEIRFDLLTLYQKMGRYELALEMIREIKRLQPLLISSTPEVRAQREWMLETELSLEETAAKVDEGLAQMREQEPDRFRQSLVAHQAGAVRLAVETLEGDAVYLEQNPQAKLLLAHWLMEVGRVREAHEMLEAIEQFSSAGGLPGWREAVAVSALTNGDYFRAIRLWSEQIHETENSSAQAGLMTLPFVTLGQFWAGPDQYPMAQTAAVMQSFNAGRVEVTLLRYQKAMAQLESGDMTGATQTLKQALERDPASPLRPLLRFYLFCTTNEQIESKPAGPSEPVEEFAPLEESSATTKPE